MRPIRDSFRSRVDSSSVRHRHEVEMWWAWAKAFAGLRTCKPGIWVRLLSKRVAVLLDACFVLSGTRALTQLLASPRSTRCHPQRLLRRLAVRGVRQSSYSSGHNPRNRGQCSPSSARFVVESMQVRASNHAKSCMGHACPREHRTQHVR